MSSEVTIYYCPQCSHRVGSSGRICATCAYIPPPSKILPKHGLSGGEWVPNAKGVLEYRILPPKMSAKPKRLCSVCKGELPKGRRSYCSAPCQSVGQKKRAAEARRRQGIAVRRLKRDELTYSPKKEEETRARMTAGRPPLPDVYDWTPETLRKANTAYQYHGRRDAWAKEGYRRYRRFLKRRQREQGRAAA